MEMPRVIGRAGVVPCMLCVEPKCSGACPQGLDPARQLRRIWFDNESGVAAGLRAAAGDFIVGSIAPAEATALAIENGEVKLTVEVDASTDLKAWQPAKTVEITVPVEGEKGFYILKTK